MAMPTERCKKTGRAEANRYSYEESCAAKTVSLSQVGMTAYLGSYRVFGLVKWRFSLWVEGNMATTQLN
jgi:hypothetical protein